MKKLLIICFISLTTFYSFAQTNNKATKEVSLQNNGNATFRLFSTQNMWIFIKLNTRNGQMWLVQFSMKNEGRFVTPLNLESLITNVIAP